MLLRMPEQLESQRCSLQLPTGSFVCKAGTTSNENGFLPSESGHGNLDKLGRTHSSKQGLLHTHILDLAQVAERLAGA